MTDKEIFWERILDMPPIEAELECVLRREKLTLENAMLVGERNKIITRNGVRNKEYDALGVAIQENNALLTRVTEHLRYIRKIQTQIRWKEAVRAICGAEVQEQCAIWIEQKYGEMKEGMNS